MMKKIMPSFKDDRDKIIVVAMMITSLFLLFIPALIVIFLLKDQISENSYNISKAFLNFELMLFIISLFCAIPIIGWLAAFILCPILYILNVIIIIIDLCAAAKGTELTVPVPFEFI